MSRFGKTGANQKGKKMVKVKALQRFGGTTGKFERGLTYFLPSPYARELVAHGLAEFVIEEVIRPPVPVTLKPSRAESRNASLKELRVKTKK
jgi:hypothetical protein